MNVGEYKATLLDWSHRTLSATTLSSVISYTAARIIDEAWPQELDQQYEFDEEAGVNIRSQVWALPLPPRTSRVWEVWNDEIRIESVRPGRLIEDCGRQGNAGKPQKHTIVGKQLWLAPGLGGDVRCIYNQLDEGLDGTDDSASNYGLSNFPHLYLWLGLARVEAYSQNYEGEAANTSRYDAERSSYNNVQHARRQGGGATGTT